MANDLEQGAIGVQLGKPPRHQASGMALRVGEVGVVNPGAAGAPDFAGNRAG
jgi:hypothetical protein